jgi:hypothetical protein
MTERTAMILIVTGLIFTLFGVGGVEASITDTELVTSLVVSIIGMLIMYSGTLALKVSDSYR